MGMIVAHKIRNLIIFNHNAFLAKKKMLQNQNNNKKRVLFSKVCITNFNFPYIFQRKKKEKKNQIRMYICIIKYLPQVRFLHPTYYQYNIFIKKK